MFLNRSQIAAAVTGLVLVVGAGSVSQITLAETAATQKTQGHKEQHPELLAALSELKLARTHLQKGAHDFGGERVEALNDTNKAITEVEQAIKADQH